MLVVGASQFKTADASPPTAVKSRGTLGAIGTGADQADFVYSNKFAEPDPAPTTTSGVAYVSNFVATAAGDMAESASSKSAAAPATWGEAIEVPDLPRSAVDEVNQAEVIDEPGAKISKQLP